MITSAAHSSDSSSGSTAARDSNAGRPKTVGFEWSAPLSIVTRASGRSTSGLATRVRELRDEPDARRGKWMAAGDRAAVRVQPLVVRRDAHALAPRQHLHGERFVELERIDLIEVQPGLVEHFRRRGHRPHPHQLRLDAGEGERNQPKLRLEAELLGRPLGREQ